MEPGQDEDIDQARRRRIIASDARFRIIFAVLAVVVPLALFSLFRRHELRLRALADHGRTATATLTYATREGTSHYRYEVSGVTHTWNVARAQAPFAPGQEFPITYLPEDPSLSRPGASYSIARLEAEIDLSFQRRILLGLFAFFAACSALCHVQLRRLRRGEPLRTKPRLSPEWAGRLVALLLLAVTLGVNGAPEVQKVQTAAFGAVPLGVPVAVVVSLVEVVLFLPYFWVFPHLMRIVMDPHARGGPLSRAGILFAVLQAPPEHRRSRALVIAGLVYFFALMAAWIAFAQSRGV